MSLEALQANPNFSGDIVTKADPGYADAIRRWSITAQFEAAFVVYPKDAPAIAATIGWAVGLRLPIAVKGGGHSASGTSSIEGGVVIDLWKYLGTVSVDATAKKVSIGGGALWSAVNEETIKYGLAAPGPTINHVGVGGFILGGGYGYLTSAAGLAADNLLEATVVTASGEIVKASATENEDLFWGIRGGGGNFGVVSEFVVKLHPQRNTVYSGLLAFPGAPEVVKKLFDSASEWYKTMGTQNALYIFLAKPPHIGQPMAMVHIYHNGPEEEGKKIFKWAFDLGPLNPDDPKEIPYTEANALQNQFAPGGLHNWVASNSHDPFVNDVSTGLYPKLLEVDNREGNVINHAILFEYYNTQKIQEVAPNATAYPLRDARCNSVILAVWASDDPAVKIQARKDLLDLTTAAGTPEGPKGIHYTNLTADDQLPPSEVAKVFKDNYPRLQQIKAKYDPNGVFSRWFGIGPAA